MLSARTSQAQEIVIANASSLPRVDAAGNQLAKRSLALDPETVSDQDCLDDQRIRFAMTLSDYAANATVQAWASSSGQDCAQAPNRAGATQQCWRLVDGNIPLQQQQNVDIPVRRIMSGASPLLPNAPDATGSVCGKVGLSTITVEFLYFAPGSTSAAAVTTTTAVTVDTVDPPGTAGGTATNANTVGCSAAPGTTAGSATLLLGLVTAAFVRRRRR